MIVLACLLIAVLSVPMAGGRLGALADLRFRHGWLLALGLGLQILIISVAPGGDGPLHQAAHMLSYLLAGAFLVLNRRVPFLWLVGSGGLMNFTAIAANDGVMPASRSALRTAGLAVESGFTNSAFLTHPRVPFLGDIFAIPAGLPLSNVFSAGDILIVLGAFVLLHRVCESRLVPRGGGELSALRRNPTFARVWLAQAVSALGDWVYSITAVTVVAQSGRGAGAIALLLALQLGPAALVGALGGPLVDRLSRRGLMIAGDLVRAAAVASLVVVPGDPAIAHLGVVAVCLGGFGALFAPSLQASLPNLLPPQQLVAANAVLSSTFTFAVTAGPLIGGIVVAQLGPRPGFALNAASFAVSAVLILAARLPRQAASSERLSPLRDLREGLLHIARSPLTRSLLLVLGLVMLAAAFKAPLEPMFVLETLAERPEALGLVGAAWGLGMLVGAVLTPAAARRWPRQALISVAIGIVGAVILAASQLDVVGGVLVLWVAGGAANAVGTIAHETLLQETTPDGLRGRVFAASDAILDGAFLFGALAGGVLGAVMGIRPALAACGVILLAAAALSHALLGSGARSPALQPALDSRSWS
jgi:predicted MFS family arabinose efflux permease